MLLLILSVKQVLKSATFKQGGFFNRVGRNRMWTCKNRVYNHMYHRYVNFKWFYLTHKGGRWIALKERRPLNQFISAETELIVGERVAVSLCSALAESLLLLGGKQPHLPLLLADTHAPFAREVLLG